MRKTFILILLLFVLSCTSDKEKNNFQLTTRPSFKVNFNMPTADKPQSKLWFMDNFWWAILPDSIGPTLWQRTPQGWKEYPEIKDAFIGVPGRADVWPEKRSVTAVGVADSSLTVFRLTNKSVSETFNWKYEILAQLHPPSPGTIETATIVKAGDGNWWVAATANSEVCVWNSVNNGKNWGTPDVLAKGLHKDDICTITPVKEGVGVIWSDQIRDKVVMRIHKNESPVNIWEKEEIIESGNKTADDHLNTVLTSDGTLWLTTKNSVDKIGKPQFVFRVRSVEGKWQNIPYLLLEETKRPSRPIVIASDDNSYILVGHGDNDRAVPYPYNSNIVFAVIPVDSVSQQKLNKPQAVIAPDSTYKYVVHNVTGPRNPFPKNAPWIILASDASGNVYEADLKKLIK